MPPIVNCALVVCLFVLVIGRSVGRLAGWVLGWLRIVWLIGWFVGWQVLVHGLGPWSGGRVGINRERLTVAWTGIVPGRARFVRHLSRDSKKPRLTHP